MALAGSALAGATGFASPAIAAGSGAQTTQGTDFWVTFEGNYDGGSNLYLFTAGDAATSGTVSIPGISFSQAFTVTPGAVTQISIPSNAQDLTSDQVGNYGIHITSGSPVSVYGLNTEQYTTDGFLGLPTGILGTKYLVEAYTNDIGAGSQFEVVATQDNTTVQITPSENVGAYTAGTPYTVKLNQGQTYQLNDASVADGDLTGTAVSSDNPVAVFAGSNCVDVPAGVTACNTLTEEMTPTNSWGQSFITEPLAGRAADTFRFLASQDNTTVNVNGAAVATLNAGKFFETTLSAASVITADKPIHVMQYSEGEDSDGADSDPFDITIAPYAQFLNSYTVTTEPDGADPAITNNDINVVAPTSEVGSVTLDGTAIPASSFTAIPGSSFSGAQLPVAFGSHVLGGPLPFGITVYGNGGYDGYGYPGGFTLSPIAVVNKVSLSLSSGGTSPIGSQACASGSVTDQNNNPLSGVRVDFTVTGANPNTGFAYTDATGVAQYCYIGTTVGNDTINAAVQSIHSSPATWVWTAKADSPPTADPQTVVTPQNTAVPVTLTGSDPDNDPITYTVASSPSHGTLSGTAPNLTYTPTAGYSGSDSFTFTTSDGKLSSSPATVSITVTKVNHAPTANAQSVTTMENTAAPITLTGSDPDGDTITFAVATSPAHGTLSGTAPNLTYTPSAGYSGSDSFTFTTSDGALSSSPATVTITVTPTTTTCSGADPAPTVDVSVAANQGSHSSKLTSPKFTTAAAGELIVAFVEADGPEAPNQTVSKISGGGLVWKLAVRSNSTWGTTEVWQAFATATISNATVTATLAKVGYDGSITVAAFKGAASAVAATAVGAAKKGAPGATITPAKCNSLVWAAGHDWSHANIPVASAGQTITHLYVDRGVNDTFWTQNVNAPSIAGTPVTVGDTGILTDRWTLATVEIPAS